ncbi:hypothetical protein ACLOJK_030888 [Asimina triloba]
MEVTEPPREVLTVQTPVKTEKRTLQSPSVSRFTRSQVAPDWTIQEMLVLVNEFAAVNNHDLRKLPSCQKWKMISQNMADLNVIRSPNQCQRKWESLLFDFRKIKDWELQFGNAAFLSLDNESKKDLGFPAFFDRELFSLMDAFLVVHRSQFVSEIDSGLDRLPKVKVKPLAITGTSGMAACLSHSCFKKETCSGTQTGNASKEQDMAKKLQGSTQLVHEILGREFTESMGSGGPPDFKSPIDPKIEFVRQQADDLIRVFETLVDNLNQFTELVKGSGE